MGACFIDTQRPATPAETAAWKLFLRLPRDYWTAARVMFRRAHNGTAPGEALLGFTADTGLDDAAVLAELEAVLKGLAAQPRGGGEGERFLRSLADRERLLRSVS